MASFRVLFKALSCASLLHSTSSTQLPSTAEGNHAGGPRYRYFNHGAKLRAAGGFSKRKGPVQFRGRPLSSRTLGPLNHNLDLIPRLPEKVSQSTLKFYSLLTMDSQSKYHFTDVGRILLQVKDEITNLRSGLSEGEGKHLTRRELESILDRAEQELQLKVDVVLNSLLQSDVATLPALGSTAARSGERPVSPIQQQKHIGSQRMQQVSRTDSFPRLSNTKPLSELAKAGQASPVNKGQRQVGKRTGGAKVLGKTTKPQLLLPKEARSENGPLPPISKEEARKGIFNLLNRGMVPAGTDVGVVFRAGHGVLQQGPAPLHPPSEKHWKQDTMLAPFGLPTGTVRMDLRPVEPMKNLDLPKWKQHAPDSNHSVKPTLVDFDIPGKSGRTPRGWESNASSARPGITASSPMAHQPVSPKATTPIRSSRESISSRSLRKAPESVRPMAPRATSPARSERSAKDQDEIEEERFLQEGANKIRGYAELMDEFSLHQFIIRHGKVLSKTPEYESFKRTNSHNWGAILSVVRALEDLMAQYGIPIAYIDGQTVATLARDEVTQRNWSANDLLKCVANVDQVEPLVRIPGRRFQTQSQPSERSIEPTAAAATAIQSVWRMHYHRSIYDERKRVLKGIRNMQKLWRSKKQLEATRAIISEKLRSEDEEWERMQQEFREEWPSIQQTKRIEIHIPSFSASERERLNTPNFLIRQNIQISRLGMAKDPSVDIIYVAPFEIQKDVFEYYMKFLQLGCEGDIASRIKVVVPENAHRFKEHMSLARALQYSPRAVRKIKRFCKGRAAYIVPADVGEEDKRLSQMLSIPLLAGNPQTTALLRRKSTARAVFDAADVLTAPGATHIANETHALDALASLVTQYVDVDTWLVKMEETTGGSGVLQIDVSKYEIVQQLRKEKATFSQHHTGYWEGADTLTEAKQKILVSIGRKLLRGSACNTFVYPTAKAFWKEFNSRGGGIIEACAPKQLTAGSPSVNIFLHPHGRVEVLSAHEQLFAKPFVYSGCAFPQKLIPHAALQGAAQTVGEKLYEEGVMGYVGLDFVAWWDESVQAHRMWAVDLNLRMTHSQATYTLFSMLMGGGMHSRTGEYYLPITDATARKLEQIEAELEGDEVDTQASSHRPATGLSTRARPLTGGSPSSPNSTPGNVPGMSREEVLQGLAHSPRSREQVEAKAKEEEQKERRLLALRKKKKIVRKLRRCYVAHEYVHHRNLSLLNYSTFFNQCRVHGISFDLSDHVGTAFILLDSMAGGTIGILSCGKNPIDSTSRMRNTLRFLGNEVGTKAHSTDFDEDESNFEGLSLCIRTRAKQLGLDPK